MWLLRAFVERCGVLTGLTPLAKVSLAAIADDARRLANIAFDARRFMFKRDATISTYDTQIPWRYACDAVGHGPPKRPQKHPIRQLLRCFGTVPREAQQQPFGRMSGTFF